MYKRAIVKVAAYESNFEKRCYYRSLTEKCDKLVLLIPDRWIYTQIFGNGDNYNPEEVISLWKDHKWIEDVFVIDLQYMRLEQLAEIIKFDAVFYATEYGELFEEDSLYCSSKKIDMLPIQLDGGNHFDMLFEERLNIINLEKKTIRYHMTRWECDSKIDSYVAIIRTIVIDDNLENRNYYKSIATKYGKLILAVPDRWMYARIFGSDLGYDPERVRNIWKDYKWVEDVLILDQRHIRLSELEGLAKFDTVLYGVEYGQIFIEDARYCDRNSINMVSLAPEKYLQSDVPNAMEMYLRDVPPTKKIVLFGTGRYFEIFMQYYGDRFKPAYAIDNDEVKWGTEKLGVLIREPHVLKNESINDIFIVICSKEYADIRKQILNINEFDYRPMLYNNTHALFEEFLIDAVHEKIYMDKAARVLDELMREFDRVCKKYRLKYYVISGSLIGVVRHHGTIPWDDDIDVGMPREDLEKLKKIAPMEWDGDKYLFLNYDQLGNNAFLDFMPRLYYMKENFPTKIMDKVRGKMSAPVADKLILDIYPMDNASNKQRKHAFNMIRIKLYYNLLMGHRGYIDYNEYNKLSPKQIKIIKLVNCIGRVIPYKLLVGLAEHAIRCENKHETESYYMSSGPIVHVERIYKKEFFAEGKYMDFNDFQVRVPVNYNELLHAQQYGNYMEFPPYAVRKPSHYFNADISIW